MQISKPLIKSLPKHLVPELDFRFGPVNVAVLVVLATIAAIIYASVGTGNTLRGILATILGAVAITGVVRSVPMWESVIISSIAIWVVMHLWIQPMYEWLLTGTLIGGTLIWSCFHRTFFAPDRTVSS